MNSDTQAMEEAGNDLQEPDEAEQVVWLQHDPRGYIQGGTFEPWTISPKWDGCSQLPAKPESPVYTQ